MEFLYLLIIAIVIAIVWFMPKEMFSKNANTGPRGGKYYINSKGKKTYIKK